VNIDLTNPNTKAFVNYIHKWTSDRSKTISLRKRNYLLLNGADRCVGWCDGDEMAVAVKHPRALSVLVHEFCHMLQASEKHPAWTNLNTIDVWLGKSDWPLSESWESVYNSLLVEHDCERRSVKMIKQWKLPIDVDEYIQAANLYLLLYQYVYLRKKWVRSDKLYKPRLIALMPKKLMSATSLKTINMDLMLEFDKEFSV
jgi:hypothetical protein